MWRPPCSTSLVTWLVVVAVPGLLLPLHTLLAATSSQGQVRAVAGVTLVSGAVVTRGDTCTVYPARVQVVLVTATVHLVGAEYLLSPQPRDQDTFLLALMVDMFFAWLY